MLVKPMERNTLVTVAALHANALLAVSKAYATAACLPKSIADKDEAGTTADICLNKKGEDCTLDVTTGALVLQKQPKLHFAFVPIAVS